MLCLAFEKRLKKQVNYCEFTLKRDVIINLSVFYN